MGLVNLGETGQLNQRVGERERENKQTGMVCFTSNHSSEES